MPSRNLHAPYRDNNKDINEDKTCQMMNSPVEK